MKINSKLQNIKYIKGFTLIELLIVITIIGILTTVILQNLSISRSRALDAKVKTQLRNFRSAAEIYYNNQNPVGYTNGGNVPGCTNPPNNTIFTDTTSANGSPELYIDPANLPAGVTVVCQAKLTAYAVKATLPSNLANSYWCVDSKGTSEQVTGPIGGAVTVCP